MHNIGMPQTDDDPLWLLVDKPLRDQFEHMERYIDAPEAMAVLKGLLIFRFAPESERESEQNKELDLNNPTAFVAHRLAKTTATVRSQERFLRILHLPTYYAGPGKSDDIVFSVHGGRVTWTSRSVSDHPAVSIAPVWKHDHIYGLMKKARKGSELRVITSGFLDLRDTTAFYKRAAKNGAKVKVMMMDWRSPVFRARFRLWPAKDNWTFERFVREREQHYADLQAMAAGEYTNKGTFAVDLYDAMPIGYFQQGEATGYGRYMIIGLMMNTAPYTSGPMIEVHPEQEELWELFEDSWTAIEGAPMDSQPWRDAWTPPDVTEPANASHPPARASLSPTRGKANPKGQARPTTKKPIKKNRRR